jgi:hypothetical protein
MYACLQHTYLGWHGEKEKEKRARRRRCADYNLFFVVVEFEGTWLINSFAVALFRFGAVIDEGYFESLLHQALGGDPSSL